MDVGAADCAPAMRQSQARCCYYSICKVLFGGPRVSDRTNIRTQKFSYSFRRHSALARAAPSAV